MAQKRTLFIPEGSDPMREKFINYIMNRGKKGVARKIFEECMKIIKEKTKENPIKIFEKAVENVKPNIEVKAQRVGGSVYQIPREVPSNRQIMLSYRWILKGARSKKGAKMAQKLANELIDASNGIGLAVKKKEETHKMAQANKAFAHFARY
ncbi:30S ribosomal protein S7 [Candidatus Peregrinibacteria bacterium]|nr:30S ribosomal protein S7 [Candidatus Peregrinibacteria bacterium]